MAKIEKNDGVVEAVLRGLKGGYILVVNEPILSKETTYTDEGQTHVRLRSASLNEAVVVLDGDYPLATQGVLKDALAPHLIECGNSGWQKFDFELVYDRSKEPVGAGSYRSVLLGLGVSTSQMAETLVMARHQGVKAKVNQKGYDGTITLRDGSVLKMEVKSKELYGDSRVVLFSESQYNNADYLTYLGILPCGIVWEAWTLKMSTIRERGMAQQYPNPNGRVFYRINVHAGDKSFRALSIEQIGHLYHWLSIKDYVR